jgi:hypothetical protein
MMPAAPASASPARSVNPYSPGAFYATFLRRMALHIPCCDHYPANQLNQLGAARIGRRAISSEGGVLP